MLVGYPCDYCRQTKQNKQKEKKKQNCSRTRRKILSGIISSKTPVFFANV